MTLQQLNQLKNWHLRQGHDRQVERQLWESILTLWLLGWSSLPAALMAGDLWLPMSCVALIALPSAYVTTRARLHRQGSLRCDWLAAIVP